MHCPVLNAPPFEGDPRSDKTQVADPCCIFRHPSDAKPPKQEIADARPANRNSPPHANTCPEYEEDR